MATDDKPFLSHVQQVEEVDPNVFVPGRSNDVNDYLSLGSPQGGWVLLNTGTRTARGDDGPYSWVYYSVGWVGQGEPLFPPARPS